MNKKSKVCLPPKVELNGRQWGAASACRKELDELLSFLARYPHQFRADISGYLQASHEALAAWKKEFEDQSASPVDVEFEKNQANAWLPDVKVQLIGHSALLYREDDPAHRCLTVVPVDERFQGAIKRYCVYHFMRCSQLHDGKVWL